MKSRTDYLTIHFPSRMGFVNITSQVQDCVEKSGVREGMCLVNSMHITSSVFISVDEAGLHEDFLHWLEQLAPYDRSPEHYKHNLTGQPNADAHLKRQIMGRQAMLAITEGRLDFGPFEHIFYAEFDGNRPKRVLVKIIGE